MFFVLSKTLDLLVDPLAWALLLASAGILGGCKGWRRLSVGGPAAAMAILYGFGVSPVANRLVRGLESSASDTMSSEVVYDAVIVLGGFADTTAAASRRRDYGDAVDRLLSAYDLLRTGRARNALLCGGIVVQNTEPESDVLARQLVDWGIDRNRLVLDERSRNTRENAIEAVRLVRERDWTRLLLVTSAFHMERAAGCFRALRVPVDTLPVDVRSYDPTRFSGSWLPRAEALSMSALALHEYLGRLVYRVRGYACAKC